MANLTDIPVGETTTKVVLYTPQELMKIYVSGAVLAIAILVITFYLYKWWNARYKNYCIRQEYEELLAAGLNPDPEKYQPVDVGLPRKIIATFGVGIIILGIVQMVM
jgi:hypothetical protein